MPDGPFDPPDRTPRKSGAAGAHGLRRTLALAVVLAIVGGAAPARAADDKETDEVDRRGTWSFIWENDVFAGTDRNYTNGNRISYVSPPDAPSAGLHGAISRSFFGADAGDEIRYGLAVGQSMFTPEDTEVAQPLPDQHPYAGWLYGEYSVFAEDAGGLTIGALQVGIVGPSAYAEEAQNNVHDIINSYQVRGWDNQLKDEVAFALLLERRERALLETGLLGLELDLIPHYGVSLGTLRTHAKAGATFRFGTDLRRDFGPPRVRPAVGGSGFFEATDGFSWYLFAGAEGRAVARSIFLDGNTFKDSPSVDKEPLVVDAQAGLVMTFRSFQIAYTGVIRSPQFESQDDPQLFGSVSISVKF